MYKHEIMIIDKMDQNATIKADYYFTESVYLLN